MPEIKSGVQLFYRRWFILLIFCGLSMSNAFQWIEYSIITDVVAKFYNVSPETVNWTSMIYMLTYIPLVVPATYILDKYGLRLTALLGAFGNCLGSWIKVCSAEPSRFAVTFLGQTIAGASQIFTLGVPPRLAAVWFGPKEVSTATALGVFGNELGIAVGFFVPPLLVPHWNPNNTRTENEADVSSGFQTLFISSAVVNSVLFIMTFIWFQDSPPSPPSPAQQSAIEATMDDNYFSSLKKLLFHRDYMLLVLTYGLNVGAFYAVSTLLNQTILEFFPTEHNTVGFIGFLIVISGMAGSVLCGVILDKTKAYKLITVLVYAFTCAGMILYTFTIDLGHLWIVFVSAGILGFFMTGYLPLGFEFGAEITYPISEGTVSGLLNAAAQVFGIIETLCMAQLLKISALACNLTMSAILFLGTILTILIRGVLKRQAAGKDDFLRLDLNLAAHEESQRSTTTHSDSTQRMLSNEDSVALSTLVEPPEYEMIQLEDRDRTTGKLEISLE